MTNEPIRPLIAPFQSQAELELLQLILQDSTSYYPCNPAEPEAEVYFAALEQEVFQAGWSDDDFAIPVQVFAAQLDQIWATASEAPTIVEQHYSAGSASYCFEFVVGGSARPYCARLPAELG
jgi:hypothetical protein